MSSHLLSLIASDPTQDAARPVFSIDSPDISDGRFARPQFAGPAMGGDGDNVSPQIEWRGAPPDARSFVVTMYDPDVATGFGWWHWVVANIPASANTLPRGAGTDPQALPDGAVAVNTDLGVPGYLGPLPPPGETHGYVITVTALDVPRLELPPNATPAMVAWLALGHTVGKAFTVASGSR